MCLSSAFDLVRPSYSAAPSITMLTKCQEDPNMFQGIMISTDAHVHMYLRELQAGKAADMDGHSVTVATAGRSLCRNKERGDVYG